MRAVFVVAAMLAGSSCANRSVEGTTLHEGRWGGEQVGLDIGPDGDGRITLPCAGAAFDGPIKLGVGGHFLTSGTFTQGSGAPPPEPPKPVPANISGRLDTDGTLWLDLETAEGSKIRSAQLRHGREPVIHHCP